MFYNILEELSQMDFTFHPIKSIQIQKINVELKRPFEISGGSVKSFEPILIKIVDCDGFMGISTLDNFSTSIYDGNGTNVSYYTLQEYLSRLMKEIQSIDFTIFDVIKLLHNIRDFNNFAVSSIEMAFWDLLGKRNKIPCHRLFYLIFEKLIRKMEHFTIVNDAYKIDLNKLTKEYNSNIETGLKSKISIGLQNNFCEYLRIIDSAISKGIDAIKLKITPQKKYNFNLIKYIREYYPDLIIDTDANSSFIPKRNILGKPDLISIIKTYDSMLPYNVRMHEQPSIFKEDHLEILTILIEKTKQNFCLDESIHGPHDILKFIDLSTKINKNHYANIKIHRTGGIMNSLWILAYLHIFNSDKKTRFKLFPWGGYMPDQELSTNALLHLFSMPIETLHTDATDHNYWFKYSIFDKTLKINRGNIKLIEGNGFGLNTNEDLIEKFLINEKKLYP